MANYVDIDFKNLDSKKLEFLISMAEQELTSRREEKRDKALIKIFKGLQELAEIDYKFMHIFADDEIYITVDELAKYFIDKYGF